MTPDYMSQLVDSAHTEQNSRMRSFYRKHASWYNATRWAFLFGRDEAVRRLKVDPFEEGVLLEVGCGTGRNLKHLAQHYIQLNLIGVDVSPEMLDIADRATAQFEERIRLFQRPYAPDSFKLEQPLRFILCSYALTMFNPGWEAAIERAANDLAVDGRIVVVDFHRPGPKWFGWWMGKNHVRMDGHLLPVLKSHFDTEFESVRSVWFGLWKYFIFVGKPSVQHK